MNPLKSLQERVVLLSGLPKNIAAVDRAATHLMGFGKVCVLFFFYPTEVQILFNTSCQGGSC